MTSISRIRATWSGFAGGPGVSTFYSLGSMEAIPGLRAFFDAIKGCLPTDVTIQVEESGDIVNDVNGELTGAFAFDPVLPVTGVAGGSHAAASGAEVAWLTTTILDGHRVKGRTFLVPLVGSAFGTDGAVGEDTRTTLGGAATVLVADLTGDLVVWHRPRKAKAATSTHAAITARDGGHGLVTGSSVPTKGVVLTSRRD